MNESALSGLRLTSLLLLVVTLLGWVWFQNTFDALMHINAFITSFAFLVGVLCGKKTYASNIRFLTLIIYSAAVLITLPVLYGDIFAKYGPDFGAIIGRLFMLVVFAALFKEALLKNAA